MVEEKCKEPFPDDCPAELGQLINECRDFDSFQRPSAGGDNNNNDSISMFSYLSVTVGVQFTKFLTIFCLL